jgi:translation initiation factor 2 beta subunit (eIF-2beta)/eIF-5
MKFSLVLRMGIYITILDNFESFCDELMFDKKILIKIMGKMLSCKVGINKNGDYYLQGEYPNIKDIAYTFIQNYLLCIKCDKPEINLKCKNNKIKQKCRACGNNVYLENCKDEIIHILRK